MSVNPGGDVGTEDALLFDDDTLYERTTSVVRARLRSVATATAPAFG
jgi:hypothetical protein